MIYYLVNFPLIGKAHCGNAGECFPLHNANPVGPLACRMNATHAEANAKSGIGGRKPDGPVLAEPPHSFAKPKDLLLPNAGWSFRQTNQFDMTCSLHRKSGVFRLQI